MTYYGIPRADWHNPDSDPARVLTEAAIDAPGTDRHIAADADEWGMRHASLTLNGHAFTLYEHHEEHEPRDYAWIGDDFTENAGTTADARAAVLAWIESHR